MNTFCNQLTTSHPEGKDVLEAMPFLVYLAFAYGKKALHYGNAFFILFYLLINILY